MPQSVISTGATPIVSVLLPVHGNDPYVRAAIDSILSQTLQDFELLVLCEYGTDLEALKGTVDRDDPRIRFHINGEFLGLVKSLNEGFQRSSGRYIARMDSDDLSLHERLERQVAHLENHPETGILGTGCEFIDESGRIVGRHVPAIGSMITRWNLFFFAAVTHPTIMARREIYDTLGGYNSELVQSEDYDLWHRAVAITNIDNLPDVLLRLRLHDKSVSVVHRKRVAEAARVISQEAMSNFLRRQIPFDEVGAVKLEKSFMKSAEVASRASSLLSSLFQTYVSCFAVPQRELVYLKKDVSLRLLELSLSCWRTDITTAVRLLKKSAAFWPEGLRSFVRVCVFKFFIDLRHRE